MQAFVAINDAGSLTAAADRLDRSLPSVVRTLAALEAALGVRLLNRTTRRIALTDEGRQYLERCRRILAEVEEAERALTAGRVEPEGRLTVTAPVLFGQMHVAPVLNEFLGRFTRVRVELLLLDRVTRLVDEGLDAAVRIAHLPDSSMVAVPVGEMRRVVCASPAFLAAHGRPGHPKAVSAHPCIGFTGLAGAGAWHFRADGRALSVPVDGRFSCNQAAASVAACVAGLGFGMFLSYQVALQVRSGALEVVLEAFEPPPTPVSIVYPQARLLSARVRAFVDWTAAGLRERDWGQI